jgi:hypothetical protein
MKKILMTLAAVLCCAMTTTVFTACGGDDDTSYSTTYHYRVHFASYLTQCDITEYHEVQNAFDVAVGDVGGETINKVYHTPQDEEMKAKCEAVKKQYNNLKSNYMKFELLRISSNSSNPTVEVKDVIAIYELGNSVQ